MKIFKCKTIPNCRPGFDVIYQQRAMEIIHWMAEQLHDVPLFNDSEVTTNYGDDQLHLINQLDERFRPPEVGPGSDLSHLRYVDETVLPQRTVIRAYLDAYDHHGDSNNPPFRITSKAYALDSSPYHESVYINIQNPHNSVNVDEGVDVETLFQNRMEQNWKGVDSVYHAWLFVNHRRTPALFRLKLFAERHPDWRSVMLKTMDLSPGSRPPNQDRSETLPLLGSALPPGKLTPALSL